MSYIPDECEILYVSEVVSLADGAEIDSGFIDGQFFNGFQVTVVGDDTGLTFSQSLKFAEDSTDVATQTFPLSSPLPNSTDSTFAVPYRRRFQRIQIQNNTGSAITNVALEIKGLRGASQPTTTTLSTDPVAQSQAVLTQSVTIGLDSMGSYVNQRVTDLGAAIGADVKWETVLGNISGSTTWNKFGYNNDIDTGSSEVIASFGGTFTPPTTADTLDFVSANANDTSGGTGLNSIVITGVDENRNAQVEVLTLNGTSTVTTVNQWLGVNRVSPFLCGSGTTNAGTITGTHTTSGQVLAEMPAGETSTEQCIFYIQDGYTFVATWLYINVLRLSGGGTAPVVTIKGWVYSPVANAKILIFETKIDTDIENTIQLTPTEPFPITEQSVLWFEAETDRDNTAIDLRFSGIEVPNET